MNLSLTALLIIVITGLASFWLGRHFSRGWREKRSAKEQAQARARETRQQRRARERAEGKGR
ncbi:MAG: hypothetical protein Q4G71_02575 [Pseudomonadota bacterium]|nr:hypothetical protein [Pseudomonadota bacterium]